MHLLTTVQVQHQFLNTKVFLPHVKDMLKPQHTRFYILSYWNPYLVLFFVCEHQVHNSICFFRCSILGEAMEIYENYSLNGCLLTRIKLNLNDELGDSNKVYKNTWPSVY